jgi:hypothetical protein
MSVINWVENIKLKAIRVHDNRELILEDIFPHAYQYITAGAYFVYFFGGEQYTRSWTGTNTCFSLVDMAPQRPHRTPPPPAFLPIQIAPHPQKPRVHVYFRAKVRQKFHQVSITFPRLVGADGCGPVDHLIIKEARYTFCLSFLRPCIYLSLLTFAAVPLPASVSYVLGGQSMPHYNLYALF